MNISLYICLCLLFCGTYAKSTINVKLGAPYKSSLYSPAMEASEYIASISNYNFFQYLDSFIENMNSVNDTSDDVLMDLIIKSSNSLLDTYQKQLLLFNIKTRTYIATIEMFDQLSHSIDTKCPSQSSYIVFNNVIICSINELITLSSIISYSTPIETFEFDHIYSIQQDNSLISENESTIILYTSVGSEDFISWYPIVKSYCITHNIRFIYRHMHLGNIHESSFIQGFGIGLTIKNMEYKTIDDHIEKSTENMSERKQEDSHEDLKDIDGFNFNILTQRYTENKEDLLKFKDSLLSEKQDDDKIQIWQLKDIGLKAVQRIILSKNPLSIFEDISQNLPSRMHSLSTIPVSSKLSQDIQEQKQSINNFQNTAFFNGIEVKLNSQHFNIFEFFNSIQEQVNMFSQLNYLHLSNITINNLNDIATQWNSDSSLEDYRLPLSLYSHPAILRLNDIEKDSRYSDMYTRIEMFMMPAYGFPQVRLNYLNRLLIMDISQRSSLQQLFVLPQLIEGNIPITNLLVFVSSSLLKDYQRDPSILKMNTLNENGEIDGNMKINDSILIQTLIYVQKKSVSSAFITFINNILGRPIETVDQLASIVRTVKRKETFIKNYMKALQLGTYLPNVISACDLIIQYNLPLNVEIDNGKLLPTINIQQSMQYFWSDIRIIISGIENKDIKKLKDVMPYIYKQSNIMSAYIPELYKPYSEQDLISFVTNDYDVSLLKTSKKYEDIVVYKNSKEYLLEHSLYIYSEDWNTNQEVVPYTLFFGLDMISDIQSLKNILDSVFEIPRVRFSIINLNSSESDISNYLYSLLYSLYSNPSISFSDKKDYSLKLIDDILYTLHKDHQDNQLSSLSKDTLFSLLKSILDIDDIDISILLPSLTNAMTDYSVINNAWKLKTMKLNNFYIIMNGRIVHNLNTIESSYIHILYGMEKDKNQQFYSLYKDNADDYTRVFSFYLTLYQTYQQSLDINDFKDASNYYSIGRSSSPLQFVTIVNPLSEMGQKTSSILRLLESIFKDSIYIQILFLPDLDYNDIPLKRYYRFIANNELTDSVLFYNLPSKHVYTMNIEGPFKWNIQTYKSIYDLDNIRVEEDIIKNTNYIINAEYFINNLLVDGQCYSIENKPINMLQLEMDDVHHKHVADTIVMQNNGYFQLRANPGVWYIHIANGRSSDLYSIIDMNAFASYSNKDSSSEDDLYSQLVPSHKILLYNFLESITQIRVLKNKGKDQESLQDTKPESTTFWDNLKHKIEKQEDEVINIFSVASGHLYERFLRIMMYSVTKNTSKHVKFWIIENFISPSFKKTLPYYAVETGFDYEYVTYKWPYWLHEEKEKQRIIWGYKILFLDVLFPLHVKKIIYVDADQVTRADLNELWTMDIHGAPYAYTPLCTSNPDTQGYMFWTQGFWKDHLRGKSYHISALYVVDLQVFRQKGVGDILRSVYNRLAQDPNSLSNLDQDLPNFIQDQVPIFSLPQEWLWCESWCSMDTKSQSKTIDLCNNPLHKEPKLDMAKRVISGELFNESWIDIDNKITSFMDTLDNKLNQIEKENNSNIYNYEVHQEL